MEATFLFLLFLALFATHHQHVVVEGDLDVLFLDTGHFQGDLVLLVGFLDVQGRLQHARPIGWQPRHGQRRKTEAPERIIEQPIDLAMLLQGLTGPPATGRSLRCTGSEAVLCCSSCSFLNQFQGANFLKSISMSYLQKSIEDSLNPFARGYVQRALATRDVPLTFAAYLCVSPPSFCLLGSDH